MPRKLKTYQTSLGFYDLAVAAPSMKAALEAWGAGSNLFHQGFAKETDDPDVIAATMAQPGVVLKRPAGSSGRFAEQAGLPADLADGYGENKAAVRKSGKVDRLRRSARRKHAKLLRHSSGSRDGKIPSAAGRRRRGRRRGKARGSGCESAGSIGQGAAEARTTVRNSPGRTGRHRGADRCGRCALGKRAAAVDEGAAPRPGLGPEDLSEVLKKLRPLEGAV